MFMLFEAIIKVLIELILHKGQRDEKIVSEFLLNVFDLKVIRVLCELNHINNVFLEQSKHSLPLCNI